MNTPLLPNEVVDAVIDHLCNEHDALRVAGLVAKSWCIRSRLHLFRSIQLGRKADLERHFAELNLLITARPMLAMYVNILCIYVEGTRSDAPNLLATLPRLTSVTNLKIAGIERPCYYSLLCPAVAIALYDLMSRPVVTSLELENLSDIDAVFLAQRYHITKLQRHVRPVEGIYRSFKREGACFPLEAPPLAIPLQTHTRKSEPRVLSVVRSGSTLATILHCTAQAAKSTPIPPPPFLRPSILTCAPSTTIRNDLNDDVWKALVKHCGSTVIKYTSTSPSPCVWSFPHHIHDFTALSANLRHIFLQAPLRHLDAALATLIRELPKMTIHSRPGAGKDGSILTTLSILATWLEPAPSPHWDVNSDVLQRMTTDERWGSLDKILNASQFAGMQKFTITFRPRLTDLNLLPEVREKCDVMAKAICGRMHRLDGRNMLDIRVSMNV